MLTMPGQVLRWVGGKIDIRVAIATNLDPEGAALYDEALYDESFYASENLAWEDISEFVEQITYRRGAERWDSRFTTGTGTIVLDNTTGLFTPIGDGANPWSLPFRPGRLVRVTAHPDPTSEDEVVLFTGRIDSSEDEFDDAGFLLTTTLMLFDVLGDLAGINPPALESATGVQSTHARVNAALDRAEVPSEVRDIQTGEHTMQTSFLAQSVLEECQRAADAEGGAFFALGDGTLVFKARDWLISDERSVQVQGYLGYDTEQDPDVPHAAIEDVETSWELARVRNDISYARSEGTVQRVFDEDSIVKYGSGAGAGEGLRSPRTYQRFDLHNNSDDEVLFLAERDLKMSKEARIRVESVQIIANDDPDNEDLNRLFYDAQLGDLLSVKVKTGHGWSFERLVTLLGESGVITAEDWKVVFTVDDSPINFLTTRDVLMARLAPVAWWRFEESGGTTTADETGNGHGLTWSGGAVLSPSGGPISGGFGYATLDGSNDSADAGSSHADFALSDGDYSVEVWLNPDGDGDSIQPILWIFGAPMAEPVIEITYGTSLSNVMAWHRNTDGSITPGNSAVIPVGQWSHVVVTNQKSGSSQVVKGFVNGVQVFANTYGFAAEGVTDGFVQIGTEFDFAWFKGDLSEMTIFDRALSAADVLDLYSVSYE